MYQYYKFCVRHYDLLNYRTDLFKINNFYKPYDSAFMAVSFAFMSFCLKEFIFQQKRQHSKVVVVVVLLPEAMGST